VSSELLEKLKKLDSEAARMVAAARTEADEIAAGLAAREAELEGSAEKKLSAEIESRAAELASEREKLLAEIRAAAKTELEAIGAVSAEKKARAAEAVVARLTEE
jgi:hypothetical protein